MPAAGLAKGPFASNRYGGFVPAARVEAAMAFPPQSAGGRAFLDTKLHVPALGPPVPDATLAAGSVYSLGAAAVTPAAYAVDRRGGSLVVMPMDKEAWAVSDTTAGYPDVRAVAALLTGLPPAALDAGFDALDARRSGHLVPAELRAALREAAGGAEPPELAVVTLENLAARRGLVKDVSRPDFHALVAGAGEYLHLMLDSQAPRRLAAENSLAARAANARSPARGGAAGATTTTAGSATGATTSPTAAAAAAAAAADDDAAAAADALSATLGAADGGSRDGADGGPRRLLTAAPLARGGAPAASGLNVGALRRAQLAAEARSRGDAPAGAGHAEGGFRLTGPEVLSTYLRDLGDYGANPRARPVAGAVERGPPQTTRELSAGTTRASFHVPGYMGVVPGAAGPPHGAAAAHGLGAAARSTFHLHNNLADTTATRTPGYLGHSPAYILTQTAVPVKPKGAVAQSAYDSATGQIEAYAASAALAAAKRAAA